MLKWIILVVFIISLSVLGYMYYSLGEINASTLSLPVLPDPKTVHLVDGFKDGIHRISGVVKLPHSCYSISVDVLPEPDTNKTTIAIKSEDHMLDEKICAHITTRYPFETIADGPEDLELHLTLDGKELPLAVGRTGWTSPSGNIVNTNPQENSGQE